MTHTDREPARLDCAHCGEPALTIVLARLQGREQAFCCAGCAGAATWIADSGLGDYYRWRQAPASKVDGREDFSAWDRIDLLDEHSEIVAEGRSLRLAVDGMHCAACAWLIDKALRREEGVADVSANAVDGRMRLVWSPERVALSTLLQRIAALGYRPSLIASPEREAGRRRERNRMLLRLGIAGLGTLQAMMFSEALYLDTTGTMPEATRDMFRWLTAAVSAPVVFYAGAPFLRGAFNELRLRQPGMDTLIGSGVLLAWFGSLVETVRGGPQVWFDAAVMFVLFLLAARHLEARVRASGQSQLDALAGAQPALAWRESGATLEQVPVRELAVDDIVQVGAGNPLPCDGVVLDHAALLDEAILTGESTPRHRAPGEPALAGSLVIGRTLRLRATAVGGATSLSTLSRCVENARQQRPKLADWADRMARHVVAATLLFSVAVMAAWTFIDASRAFPIGLAVLVATCPCALALAIPAAIARAQSRIVGQGVLVLGAEALQRLADVDAVAFDKTGTLTRGEPRVIATRLFADLKADEARERAAMLETAVAHPLARAFGVPTRAATGARLYPGDGVAGDIDGEPWRIGRAGFALDAAGDDDSGIWLSRCGIAIARFDVDDAPRDEAADTVRRLRAEGLQPMILSGDAPTRVHALARAIGMSDDPLFGRLSPSGKQDAVRALQAAGRRVLMVGDGVNDAAVLAAADVSMAMARGAPLAQRQADFVLGGERLDRVVAVWRIAREARAIIRQNLAWALGYNLLVLPLAACGWIGPGLAALGMALSSLGVTVNALRIGRASP